MTGGSPTTSGTFNLTDGTLVAKIIDRGAETGRGTATRNFNFTSGTIRNAANSDLTIANVPLNLTGSGNRIFDATAGQIITIADSSVISGSDQGFTKTGDGTLALNGENTYGSAGGETEVQAGVLMVNGTSLSDTSKLVIDGGVVDVTGTEVVGSLFFGSVEQIAGVWGSSASSADVAFQDDTRFSGTGVIVVGLASGFESWAAINNAIGQSLADDHDNDGVTNGIEFFLGGPNGNTTGFTALSGGVNTAGTLSVTWTKGDGYDGTYGTDFWIETSDSLGAASWTQQTLPMGNITNDPDFVKITFSNPLGTKNFARLVVTGP